MGHRSLLQFGIGLGALVTVSVLGYACSSSSDTSGTGGGGSTGTGGSGTATGGSTGTGGTGTGSGGTTGTGGSGTATGGSSGGAQMPPAPPCLLGEKKGGTCSTAVGEGQSCYNTCGPDSIGYKLETCTAGLYVEGMCAYLSSKDYSCYKIPATVPACPLDPTTMATASIACTTPTCQPCGPSYGDSTGANKVGYCVCNSGGKWTCGSTSSNSWPCSAPGGPNTNPGCM